MKCTFWLLTALKDDLFQPREFGMAFSSFDSNVVFEVIRQISISPSKSSSSLNTSNSDPTSFILNERENRQFRREEWNETLRTCCDPFDTKKISNLSPEILVEWIVFHWAKDQNANYEGRIVFVLAIQFDQRNKKIALARGLTSVQNRQEISVNRTCKTTKTYWLPP